jgi:ureidoacrylate peracid hydrolase
MHKVKIPQDLVDRVTARMQSGQDHVPIPGPETALLAIDMQNYYLMEGQQAECPVARDIVPNVNRLAAALRDAGGLVVWIKMRASEEDCKGWPVLNNRLRPENRERRMRELSEGGVGFELWAGLDVRPGDEIVVKTRYSAFTRGSSTLEELLLARGIRTVLVTGVSTNTCCESTARDAVMLNFTTMMVADGCATKTDAAHNATLCSFYNAFGEIPATDEIIPRLDRTIPRETAASG